MDPGTVAAALIELVGTSEETADSLKLEVCGIRKLMFGI